MAEPAAKAKPFPTYLGGDGLPIHVVVCPDDPDSREHALVHKWGATLQIVDFKSRERDAFGEIALCKLCARGATSENKPFRN